ncbi:cytochrome c3 family protein [uncultured Ferrimonas sp.]|uniref:cytochrome c3 family protein n=1 Tax=uncultured Ferrimonas sp. TaxID=432640 RepID=UPI0026222B60|nr:cytochrome c3 family protein [uncultured Ferrimonas sp.]
MNRSLLALMMAFGLNVAANATLAEQHVEMNDGCETCHAEGAPSADGSYEVEQCKACHGEMAEMEGIHPKHDGLLECSDCHQPHEQDTAAEVSCDSCHDDGRKAQ